MKKEKLSAEERRKLVTDFFRKITEVTDAADEMSNILKNGGPAPDSTKLSKVFESMRDSHITSSTLKSKKKKRVKEDVKASKEYLLAHLLIINGISPNGFMSSKGKILICGLLT